MKRTYVMIDLALTSSWRIGDWQPDDANTLATLRDPTDPTRVWIPGSSIAGSLRRAGGDPVALFGSEPPDSPKSGPLTQSPWWILGVSISDSQQVRPRARTAIDRFRRSAAKRGLFTADEVRPGEHGTATIYLRSDNLDESGLEQWIRRWQPRIGGGRSVGMGRASVTAMTARSFDLADNDNLRTLLGTLGCGPDRVRALLAGAKPVPIDGPADEPWLTADIHIGHLAVTREDEDRTEGSTLKGLLRSRVEFIGRSLGHTVCRGKEGADWTGDDCDVCKVFGSTVRRGVLEFETARWAPDPALTVVTRIAIDRFTSGALDGALWPQSYRAGVRFTLRIHKTGELPAWVERALFHSLNDLNDHLCTIGPEGACGYGFATVENVTLDTKPTDLAALCGAVPAAEESP